MRKQSLLLFGTLSLMFTLQSNVALSDDNLCKPNTGKWVCPPGHDFEWRPTTWQRPADANALPGTLPLPNFNVDAVCGYIAKHINASKNSCIIEDQSYYDELKAGEWNEASEDTQSRCVTFALRTSVEEASLWLTQRVQLMGLYQVLGRCVSARLNVEVRARPQAPAHFKP